MITRADGSCRSVCSARALPVRRAGERAARPRVGCPRPRPLDRRAPAAGMADRSLGASGDPVCAVPAELSSVRAMRPRRGGVRRRSCKSVSAGRAPRVAGSFAPSGGSSGSFCMMSRRERRAGSAVATSAAVASSTSASMLAVKTRERRGRAPVPAGRAPSSASWVRASASGSIG